jgi:hypothetical protein
MESAGIVRHLFAPPGGRGYLGRKFFCINRLAGAGTAKVFIADTLELKYPLSIIYAAWTARRGQVRAGLHNSIHMLIVASGR